MHVAVVGTGHVGLVTGVTLARLGHRVVGTDADEEKIHSLERGQAPFFEPGLQDLLTSTAADVGLRFASDTGQAVPEADVVSVCVRTPADANGDANLLAMERVAREVARHARDGVVVVEESTVPAGTAQRIRQTLSRERPGLDFDVVCNPEFLRQGRAVRDALEPDRILVGADSPRGSEIMRRLYAPLVQKGYRLIETDLETAELAKHASNAFLALKISYANALAQLCERAGADVVKVVEVMGADPRIGWEFLDAGIGYGGYCFPKDLMAFGGWRRSWAFRSPCSRRSLASMSR